MKATKIMYWSFTGLISAMMLFSAYAYFTVPEVALNFNRVGFHDFFRIELGIAKILGVIVLLAPFGGRLKEWAYAGFTIVFISAVIAHLAEGDPVSAAVMPVVALALLMGSYAMYHRLRGTAATV